MNTHTQLPVLRHRWRRSMALVVALALSVGACDVTAPDMPASGQLPSDQETTPPRTTEWLEAFLDTITPAPPNTLVATVVRSHPRGHSSGFRGSVTCRLYDSTLAIYGDNEIYLGYDIHITAPLSAIGASASETTQSGSNLVGLLQLTRCDPLDNTRPDVASAIAIRLTSIDSLSGTISGVFAAEVLNAWTRFDGTWVVGDPYVLVGSFTDVPILRRPAMTLTITRSPDGRSWRCERLIESRTIDSYSDDGLSIRATVEEEASGTRFGLAVTWTDALRLGAHAPSRDGLWLDVDEGTSNARRLSSRANDSFNTIEITSIDAPRHTFSGTFQMRVYDWNSVVYIIRDGSFTDFPIP